MVKRLLITIEQDEYDKILTKKNQLQLDLNVSRLSWHNYFRKINGLPTRK